MNDRNPDPANRRPAHESERASGVQDRSFDPNATVPDMPLAEGAPPPVSAAPVTPRTDLPFAPTPARAFAAANSTTPGVGRGAFTGMRNATVPGVGNSTVLGLGEMPASFLASLPVDAAATQVGMPPPSDPFVPGVLQASPSDTWIDSAPRPPPSDPFVENAITAPASHRAPSYGENITAPPPPDPDDLVRGIEGDRRAQTPIVHTPESRGRDGASHAAVVQPAPGQADFPAEPLVVVDVGTDPSSKSVTSVLAGPRHLDPGRAVVTAVPAPPRNKVPIVLVACIFGVCFVLFVAIIGTLAAKYLPSRSASPTASTASPVSPTASASVTSVAATKPLPVAAPVVPAAPVAPEPATATPEPAPARPQATTIKPSPKPRPASSGSRPSELERELQQGID